MAAPGARPDGSTRASSASGARAVVAEDEPLLAASLVGELGRLWPELDVVASVGDGDQAIETTLAERPDVVFLDIRMPGASGLEAAEAIADDWPAATPFPLIVFVTAYDAHAVQAFERAAFDYLLKPVEPARLAKTCDRLRAALAERRRAAGEGTPAADPAGSPGLGADALQLADVAERLRSLLGATERSTVAPLSVIQAGVGNAVHMVPVDEVVFFEAADKYVRVLTADREYLIRTSLRELVPRLDPARFRQVHRGTVVRADAIAAAHRDDAGKVTLALRERPEKVVVSRVYAPLFKPM